MSTTGGPAKPARRNDSNDAVRSAGVENLAEQFPFNAAKPSEFTAQAAPGAHKGARDPRVGSSTLSETNDSPKAGSSEPHPGLNPAAGSLDRVRVDSAGRPITTNQGVAVADNQNSLKGGLRGPA